MTVEVDHGAVAGFVSTMHAAGADLDGVCASIPTSTGTGDAAPLLGDILFTVSGVVAQLAYEADLIAQRAQECADAYRSTDSAVQERLSQLFDPRAGE